MVEKKKNKPKFEDIAASVLSGDALKNALNFAIYLRENKMNPIWSATNAWKVSYKTFTICFIRLHGAADYHNLSLGDWHINPFIGSYESDTLSSEDKDIAWANKKPCRVCNGCALPLDKIFGKDFVPACESSVLFVNPNNAAVKCAKSIIKLRRNEIKEGKARKHQYVAMRNR